MQCLAVNPATCSLKQISESLSVPGMMAVLLLRFSEVGCREITRLLGTWCSGIFLNCLLSMHRITGTATGGGTTIHNNQRLMISHLGSSWKDDPEKGGNEPFLDAAIVGWNMRDKKTADGPMTFLRPDNFRFDAGKHHFTPIYEQSKYKYLIYADGHCAACRYGFMMRLGSVILKVTTCKSESITSQWSD